MSLNDIVSNIVSTIEGDSDWQTWVNSVWLRLPQAEACKDEDAALKKPAIQDMPMSMVFTTSGIPDYDSNTAIRGLMGISIITWLYRYDESRDLADDLRTAQEYIMQALMGDDSRGGYAWWCDIVGVGEPVTDEDPAGYIKTDIEVYYTVQEAS